MFEKLALWALLLKNCMKHAPNRTVGLECRANSEHFTEEFLDAILERQIEGIDESQKLLFEFMSRNRNRTEPLYPNARYESIPLLTTDIVIKDRYDSATASTRWHVQSDTPYISTVFGKVREEAAAPLLFVFNPMIVSGKDSLISSYFIGRDARVIEDGFQVMDQDRHIFKHIGNICGSEAYMTNLNHLFRR